MEKQPIQHRREHSDVLDSLPAGVLRCLNDSAFTILQTNQGFLKLFGFTENELAGQFHNSFLGMVHPSERQHFLAQAAGQLKKGSRFSFSFRAACKGGGYKLFAGSAALAQEDDSCFDCVLLDLSGARDAQEELTHSLERLQIIMDQISDIIFEWDIPNDTITYSPNWLEKFGYAPHYGGTEHIGSTFRHFHPDDAVSMAAGMEKIKGGAVQTMLDVRIRHANGRYIWCRLRAATQFDGAGRPLRAVGTIADIDEEKRLIDDLRKRAELDALTGLYNHAETEKRTRLHLDGRPDEICALFIIDVDDFKHVNDGQGHLFGDAVLSELAAGLKRLARKSDIIGRIGGDEFAMFLKGISSAEIAEEKARSLTKLFQNLLEGEKQPIEVTCSIGVALYPADGENFQALYHRADLALYQAKSRGKNQYAFFDAENMGAMERTGYSSLGAVIDSDQQAGGGSGDLVNYVFQILYDTSDIDRAIQATLEIVGRRFDVSRAYIFENSEDGKYTDNTYEWCNEGITPQKEFLQHYPYESVKGYRELFKENAIFYCRDVHSLTPEQTTLFESQGIRSTLQCALLEGTDFRGFIGFDECTGLRLWNKEEIGMLSLIAQMLTTFLLKKREADRDRRMMVQLNTILDTQNAYIYAIAQDTYQLLYFNHKTAAFDPAIQVGMTCYQALFGRNSPCERCPLTGAAEIYNPRYDIWSKVQVSTMKWGGSSAYLLTCFDITEYRRMQGPGN